MKVGVKSKLAAILVICSVLLMAGNAIAATNVRITVVDSTNNIEAGGNVTFTMIVENLAGSNLTYDMFASGYPAGWEASFSDDQFALNASGSPYDNKTIILTLTAPDDADPGTTVDVVVEASQTTNRANTDSATFTAIVGATYDVKIVIDAFQDNIGDVTQGDECRYGFYVFNKGSADDTYDLDLVGFPSGWSFSFGGDEDFDLDAHTGKHVNLDVEVPLTATLGATTFDVRATSRSDSSSTDSDTLGLTIVSNATAGGIEIVEASINPDPDLATFEAGERTTIQIPVKSTFAVSRLVTMTWSIKVDFWNATSGKMESWEYDSESIPNGVTQGGGMDPYTDPFKLDIDPYVASQFGRWVCYYVYTEENQVTGGNITVKKPTQTAAIAGGATKTFTFEVAVPANAYNGDQATITVRATTLADISKYDATTFGAEGEGSEPSEAEGVVTPSIDTTTLLLGIGAIVLVVVIAAVAVGAGGGSAGGSTSRRGRKKRRR